MKNLTNLEEVVAALNAGGENCEVIFDESGNFQIWGVGADCETKYLDGHMDTEDEEYWELFRYHKTTQFRQVGINNVE